QSLRRDYVNDYGEGDLGVKFHVDLVETDRFDRLQDVDLAPLQLDPGESGDTFDDVTNVDRSVQLAFITCLCGEDNPATRQLLGKAFGLVAGLRLGLDPGAANRLGLLEGTVIGDDRQLPR